MLSNKSIFWYDKDLSFDFFFFIRNVTTAAIITIIRMIVITIAIIIELFFSIKNERQTSSSFWHLNFVESGVLAILFLINFLQSKFPHIILVSSFNFKSLSIYNFVEVDVEKFMICGSSFVFLINIWISLIFEFDKFHHYLIDFLKRQEIFFYLA